MLGVPCVTIRENTERPVTVTHGTIPPPFWDGKGAERIVEILAKEQKSGPEYRMKNGTDGGGGEVLKSLCSGLRNCNFKT